MNKHELKRCPFCGHWPILEERHSYRVVTCPDCYAAGPFYIDPGSSVKDAIFLWNMRQKKSGTGTGTIDQLAQALANYAEWTRKGEVSASDIDSEMLEAAADSIITLYDALECLLYHAVNTGELPEYGPVTKARNALISAKNSYPQ